MRAGFWRQREHRSSSNAGQIQFTLACANLLTPESGQDQASCAEYDQLLLTEMRDADLQPTKCGCCARAETKLSLKKENRRKGWTSRQNSHSICGLPRPQ